eukprot:scaffold204431_cov23-Tisochrysis_lutea.AAC.1
MSNVYSTGNKEHFIHAWLCVGKRVGDGKLHLPQSERFTPQVLQVIEQPCHISVGHRPKGYCLDLGAASGTAAEPAQPWADSLQLAQPLCLPSLHIFSPQDGLVSAEQSKQLAAQFDASRSQKMEHELGQ